MTGTLEIKTTGAATSTDHAAVRFDGATGEIIQDSSVVISDADAVSGITQLDVDNVQIDGNSISSTNADGNIILEPNGTGDIVFGSAEVTVEQYIMHAGDVNNFIEFGTDTQDFQTGGNSRMDVSDSGVRLGAANARVTTVLDEDSMASASATSLATQQSIKAYVDSSVATQEYKKSALSASTAALTVTYDNGTAGVGATLTNAGAQAAFALDGLTPAASTRALIKDQAAPAQNGMYVVTDVGSGSTNWVLTRSTDYDQVAEMDPGVLVTVDAGGTVNALTSWMQTTTVTTIGTDAITYSQFTYSTTFPILTVDNLNLNGNTIISLDANGNINLTPNGTGDVVIIGVTIDDVNAISGLTEFDCDNININGNTIISSDTDGNINLTPNGTGLNVLANCQVTNVTASRAVVTDASSNLNESATTATEIGYVSGLTSAIQTQMNAKVTGPGSSTDHAVVRWDLATGYLVQDSSVLINDTNEVSGITKLDVDNVNIDGNTIISSDTDGNLNLTPNGTGLNVLANCQVTNVTASRAVVTDASSNLNESATTATELGYVNGVTSAIQTQINGKISQSGSQIYAADGGGSDTYAIALTPTLGAYANGLAVNFKANTANTGAATLNVDSKGAIAIKKKHDQDLADNDIEAGQIVTVVYDGTNFQMQSQIARDIAISDLADGTDGELITWDASGNPAAVAVGTATHILTSNGVGAAPTFQAAGAAAVEGAKVWGSLDGSGVIALHDSYNVASVNDEGVGDYTVTIDTDFGSANYCITGSVSDASTGSDCVLNAHDNTTARTAGAIRIIVVTVGGALADQDHVDFAMFGNQ